MKPQPHQKDVQDFLTGSGKWQKKTPGLLGKGDSAYKDLETRESVAECSVQEDLTRMPSREGPAVPTEAARISS